MSNHIKAPKSNPALVAASDHRSHGQGFVREQQLRADEGQARESLSGRGVVLRSVGNGHPGTQPPVCYASASNDENYEDGD